MLKLRKVELFGFKSFFEKTPITFSGSGITCIVGPNGCGKSNVVDAVSWVLGEQSHKMLRAERMADCIFNGTAKRPPLGMAEVTLTLVDPELSEAVAKVLDAPEEQPADPSQAAGEGPIVAGPAADLSADATETAASEQADAEENSGKKKRRLHKPPVTLRPGEVVVSRRLYRSGQSEYLINGRVARLRDIQEIFMGVGLGPDSYAIIEQGRIGQILNSKPMDRRAIIEEAAGVTMYKTKRRLSEAKLEASKLNLSRVNDILVEVEKQLASLKRQASKARRYADLREQMRGLLRVMLASKAEHLDIEAARLQSLLRDMDAAAERQAASLHELETEQERLSARSYELDAELRQKHNLLGQTALDLDRCENRITFNQEQVARLESQGAQLLAESEQAQRAAAEMDSRAAGQREAVAALREQTAALEAELREATERASGSVSEREGLEARVEELRRLAARLIEESAREHAESVQAGEAAARHAAAEEQHGARLREMESESASLSNAVHEADLVFERAERRAQQLGEAVRQTQSSLADLRRTHQETGQQLERTREALAAERAQRSSIDQILSERTYTADAVQKLFNFSAGANGNGRTREFRAVGLLADYAEVEERYEAAIEQFLRDELEYVVVESFEQARTGVALLREEMGGRATFFVDSLNKLNLRIETDPTDPASGPGILARLDKLVQFREPLGTAAKYFLPRLRMAYVVENSDIAERLAQDHPQEYFLTPDGICYHGRMVSGGRKSDAGPLALKRDLRQHESEAARLDHIFQEQQAEVARLEAKIAEGDRTLSSLMAEHVEAQKSLVAATHQREQARTEFQRVDSSLAAQRDEIARLHEEADTARSRAERARHQHEEALRSRAAAEAGAAEAAEKLAKMRQDFQAIQESVVARREELAAMSERLASAAAAERRLNDDLAQAAERILSLQQQHASLCGEKSALQDACEQLSTQVENLRNEKIRLQQEKSALEAEWESARARAGQIEETLRNRRQSLEEIRSERSQRQIEKARNDADRDYLRQTCVSELNAQPEELVAETSELLVGENLVAAETSYNEMKARAEAMGPVNMMALEEFKECEQREEFLRRERDDLVQSIENTQLTINELDHVSRQKFEEAFNFINAHFAIAFQSLFGGGTGEMRLGEPDSSGEAGIDIVAQPPGKRLQNVLLLSGGEKALTALALLIAVFRFRPSPFCILDEVDAPLDEANVGRFNKMLREMCGQTQFIVVTHNRKTMEMGSVLYGVTMQEPGVSKLVSVKWEDADQSTQPKSAAAASNAA